MSQNRVEEYLTSSGMSTMPSQTVRPGRKLNPAQSCYTVQQASDAPEDSSLPTQSWMVSDKRCARMYSVYHQGAKFWEMWVPRRRRWILMSQRYPQWCNIVVLLHL